MAYSLVSSCMTGVVSSKIGRCLSILTETGRTYKVKVAKTTLEVGDEVFISYDYGKGVIVGLSNKNAYTGSKIQPVEEETPLTKIEARELERLIRGRVFSGTEV